MKITLPSVELLLCAGCSAGIIALNPCKHNDRFLSPFYQKGNGSSVRIDNFPKIIQIVSGIQI